MRVVGSFLEYNNKFVLLRRQKHKPHGGTWGLPGGKVEAGETDAIAMIRELYEETGYRAKLAELKHIDNYTFTDSSGTFVFCTYRVVLNHKHQIILEPHAHSEYVWVSPQECLALPDLITNLDDLLVMAKYLPDYSNKE